MKACDRHAEHENSVKQAGFGLTVEDLSATLEQRMAGEHIVLSKDMCPRCWDDFQAWWKESEPQTLYAMPDLEPDEGVRTVVPIDEAQPERQG